MDAAKASELKNKIHEMEVSCYRHCSYVITLTPEQLKHTGHASIGAALEWNVARTKKEINVLVQKWEKENPD